jgi:tRNA (guanine-N7-)-methyltransferase
MALHRIPNLVVLCGEANAIFRESLKTNSVNEIFINFPDPPLDTDNSRTLFSESFVDNIRKVLKKNSAVTVLTDDKKFSEFIETQFTKSNERHVKMTLNKVPLSSDQQYQHSSFFDQLWQQRGRTDRYFCSFKKSKLSIE